MRGIRLSSQLAFELEPATKSAIRQALAGGVLAQIATDRLRSELNLILKQPHREQAVKELDQLGALEKLLPELTAGKQIAQPLDMHAEGDVFTHSLLSLSYLPAGASLRLVWATLLHDIGKVPTQSQPQTASERIRFNAHYRVGAEMARSVLERFNFAKKFISEVAWMIEYHMGIDDLPKMTKAHQRQMMLHPAFADLLELHRADAKASWSKQREKIVKPNPKFPQIEAIWQNFQAQQTRPQPNLKKDLGIDGNWLKTEFGITDGPTLGRLLERLNSAYLDKDLKSVADAKRLVEQSR